MNQARLKIVVDGGQRQLPAGLNELQALRIRASSGPARDSLTGTPVHKGTAVRAARIPQ